MTTAAARAAWVGKWTLRLGKPFLFDSTGKLSSPPTVQHPDQQFPENVTHILAYHAISSSNTTQSMINVHVNAHVARGHLRGIQP